MSLGIWVNNPSSEGMVPVSSLSKVHWVNNPSSEGIVPTSWLSKRLSKVSWVNNPSSEGMVPVNWLLMRFLANSAWLFNQVFLKGQARLPGILVPAKLEARFRSLCYTNQRAKELLNWKSHYSLNEALDRSCSNLDLLKI